MFSLTTLSRVRLHTGSLVHAITPPGSNRLACGGYVHIEDLVGREWDHPLPPETPVTCRRCSASREAE